jgi:hypothetical protein
MHFRRSKESSPFALREEGRGGQNCAGRTSGAKCGRVKRRVATPDPQTDRPVFRVLGRHDLRRLECREGKAPAAPQASFGSRKMPRFGRNLTLPVGDPS